MRYKCATKTLKLQYIISVFFKVIYEKEVYTAKVHFIPKTVTGHNFVEKNCGILQLLENEFKGLDSINCIPKILPIQDGILYYK